MDQTLWMVVFGGVAAIFHSVTVGANLTANCWGPVLGAKIISYRTALIVGLICQTAGTLAFGSETYTAYNNYLNQPVAIESHPRLTMYALMWMVIVPVIWQLLAIWHKTLVPPYLGLVASTMGATFIFPGASMLNFGQFTDSPPFVSGPSSAFIVWAYAPSTSLCFTGLVYLWYRNCFLRGEDVLHQVLWTLPYCACLTSIECGWLLIYAIGSPSGTTAFKVSPQGACIILAAVGSAACIITCLGVPHMSHHVKRRAPVTMKRMSRLGLDDATVQELSTEDVANNMKGWVQQANTWLFHRNLYAGVPADETLLRIHSTAEEFDASAEALLIPFQILMCAFLSVAYGANNGHVSMGVVAMLGHIHRAGVVPPSVDVGLALRFANAAAMALGTLLLGARLALVTGVQLAKMTPFRSYVVILYTTSAVAFMGTVNETGGVQTYVIVAAVTAVGLVEGTSHVNWNVLWQILLWWAVGFALVLGCTSALLAQVHITMGAGEKVMASIRRRTQGFLLILFETRGTADKQSDSGSVEHVAWHHRQRGAAREWSQCSVLRADSVRHLSSTDEKADFTC